MYLLLALILYLKSKGIAIAWYWYVLAIIEMCDCTHRHITIKKEVNNDR